MNADPVPAFFPPTDDDADKSHDTGDRHTDRHTDRCTDRCTDTDTDNDTDRDVAALGPWFHNLHLPDGTQTRPDHPLGDFPRFKWLELAPHLPDDLTGWRALDIGCNAGFYTFELARRGARVTGLDLDPRYLAQARWAAERFGLTGRVRFEQGQVYDLARSSDPYDLVLFMGVFYHLRYPLLGLDLVAQKALRLLVFQTLTMPGEAEFEGTHGRHMDERELLLEPGWPKLAFLEHHFASDPTNWWIPNHAGVMAMLRSSGLRVVARPGHELYLCEPDAGRPSPAATWNRAELEAATGRRTPERDATALPETLSGTLSGSS